MTVLSLGGAFLIGASAFLQPKAAQHSDADSPLKQLAVVAIGTPVPACTPRASHPYLQAAAARTPCRLTLTITLNPHPDQARSCCSSATSSSSSRCPSWR